MSYETSRRMIYVFECHNLLLYLYEVSYYWPCIVRFEVRCSSCSDLTYFRSCKKLCSRTGMSPLIFKNRQLKTKIKSHFLHFWYLYSSNFKNHPLNLLRPAAPVCAEILSKSVDAETSGMDRYF